MATTRKLMGQSHFPADNGLNLAAGGRLLLRLFCGNPGRPLDGTQVSVDMQRLLFLPPIRTRPALIAINGHDRTLDSIRINQIRWKFA
jgi:hypothetical protein